ncbi:MAG: tetratricopeptide repeat-containing sensor histidine kinase [Marinilabilia sp.]
MRYSTTVLYLVILTALLSSCREEQPLFNNNDQSAPVDTVQMQELYDRGYHSIFKHPDSATLLADSLMSLSVDHNYAPGKYDAFRLKGIIQAIRGRYEEALKQFNQAMEISETLEDSTNISVILNNKGNVYLYMSRHAKALEQYRKALSIDRQRGDRMGEANNLNNMAATYNEMGSYRKALDHYLKALRIKETFDDKGEIASTLMNIALMQQELQRYDKAREYLEQSLELMKETGDRMGLAKCKNIEGLIHQATRRYERALESYREALEINRDMDMPEQIAINLRNLAKTEIRRQNYQKAEKYALEALEAESRTSDISVKGENHQILGDIYLGRGQTSRALSHARQAINTGKKHTDKKLLRDASQTLSKILEKQGNWEEALQYHKQFKMYADSLFNTEVQKETEKMEAQYEFEKKELEIKTNQEMQEARYQQTVNRRTQLFYLSLIAVIVLGIIAIATFRSRTRIKKANEHISRQKQEIEEKTSKLEEANQKLTELTQFKAEISNMIIHDLKNPLGIILMLSNEVPDREKTDMIHESAKKMLNMVLDILDINKYEDAKLKLEFTNVRIKDIIEESLKEQDFNLKMKSIGIHRQYHSDPVACVDPNMIKRVMENLIDNAVKHSPYDEPLQIAIEEEEKTIKITISNKGPGIPPDKTRLIFEPYEQARSRGIGMIKSTGLGLAFCKMAVTAHNGKIGVDSTPNEWTSFWVTIPKSVGR